ncbi:MAG: hypothetical protein LBS24_00040 [Clostridiales Family XIII bacterium]|jgi:hypothetical protein|nr:hypothetical protein [Clostridiales Family XIII bacterium]
MNAKALGANVLGSVLGNPKKAFLVIHRQEAFETSGGSSVSELAEKVLLLSANADMGGAEISQLLGGAAKAHVMQVQYNPSSIEFLANSEPIPVNRLQQNVVSNIPSQHTRPPSVSMSVELVFDAVNVKDSFMADKANITGGLGGVVTAGAGVVNRAKGAEYTVRPQTNALLAAVLRQTTNHVTFHWSGMTFNGIVTQAQARYTMFSVSGRPVRSVVRLVFEQKLNKVDEKYWENAFNKCFGDESADGVSGGRSLGQSAGNLLNLG